MQTAWKFTLGLLFSYFVACAPVKFDQLPEPSCGAGVACIKTCTGDSCVQSFSVTRTVGHTPVDILIVNDNSGSMSQIQERFGTAFGGFLTGLESTGLDYRIAMTTTDISNDPQHGSQRFGTELISRNNGPSAYNGYGALQDGNLIDFGSAGKFLTSAVVSRDSLFLNTVKRPETAHCEASGYVEAQCPSNDERGIFALNLVVDRTADQFMRDSSAVAVVILANEDERGVSRFNPSTQADVVHLKALYPMTSYDEPETFVERFRTKYPGKTLSVHSIIVKPGDIACRNSASDLSDPNKPIIAREGYAYKKLSDLTGGTVGSICEWSSGGYTSQLQNIGHSIQQQVLALPFSCRPVGDNYTVTVTPHQAVTWTPNWVSMQLTSDQPLPAGTTVTLDYSCQL